MKYIFTCVLFALLLNTTHAQWTTPLNRFEDSLHIVVANTVDEQQHAFVIQSFPDSGWFVIWEDSRNNALSKTDIYAQKYDKQGNALWAANGLPVVNGTNDQHFTWGSNEDYRNRHYAATDSAGGFYIGFTDDSLAGGGDWLRICVQHMRSNGSTFYPLSTGFIAAQTPVGQTYNFEEPQLIADEAKGFFLSYVQQSDNDYVYVYDFSDITGTPILTGGGIVNQNAVEESVGAPCSGAVKLNVIFPSTRIFDYNIWNDLQGGCNVVVSMNGNNGSQGPILCYNRLWKARKNATVLQPSLFASGGPRTDTLIYNTGQLYLLYRINILNQDASCTVSTDHFFWTDQRLLSNGYLPIEQGGVEYAFPKGTTVHSGGNINISLLASRNRIFDGTSATLPTVVGHTFADEIFDSIPYQKLSSGDPFQAYNTIVPVGTNVFPDFADTLLASGSGASDFSLAGSGTEIYTAALMVEAGMPTRSLRMQHLHVQRESTTSYSLQFTTSSNKGDLIGKEVSSAQAGGGLIYDMPLLTPNANGNVLFSILENQSRIRVSPVGNAAELTWGAMGKPIGTGNFKTSPYTPVNPFAAVDPVNGTAVVSWQDNRIISVPNGDNVLMQHLDSLNVADYTPLNKKVQSLSNGNTYANATVLTGSSKKFGTLEAFNFITGTTSPIIELSDSYNLGSVIANIYENTGGIRSHSGKVYLDRNYTITPEHNPAGAADITVRLFFTSAEFDALKAADPLILTPADLGVLKQTSVSTLADAVYAPVVGEEIIQQKSWNAVDGGYYIEITVNSFSNFFIQQVANALPVTWLGVQASWQDKTQAKIDWQVSEEQHVKDYRVQQSKDGYSFHEVCHVKAKGSDNYSCTISADNSHLHYFRVLQSDLDNKFSYSKTVLLNASVNSTVTIYPNPVSNQLFLNGLSGYQNLQLRDMNGKTMIQTNIVAAQQVIDVSKLAPGMYILTLRSADKIENLKLMKK